MPDLSFLPGYERHLTFEALAHCPRHYKHLADVREGKRPAKPAGTSLLVGIGADLILGELWNQIGLDHSWEPEQAFRAGWEALHIQEKNNPAFQAEKDAVRKELELLAFQYVQQWSDVRRWQVEAVHPYEQEANVPRLLVPLSDGSFYLTMPDLEVRIDGVRTIVDFKTSRFPYKPEEWAYSIQMLTYCLAASEDEPIQYLIDYCQRPYRRVKALEQQQKILALALGSLAESDAAPRKTPALGGQWVFPVTHPFVFDSERRETAQSWLGMVQERKTLYAREPHPMGSGEFGGLYEPWPRDPSACRTWYGRCEWETACFGGGE